MGRTPKRWKLGAVLIAPTVATLVLSGSALGLFQPLEWATRDLFFQLRPQSKADPEIVLITIDETDLTKIGDWPIPDAVLAEALTKVRSLEPSVIGLDLYRNLPEGKGYDKLEAVFRSTPNLIGVEGVLGPQRVAPPPVLDEAGQVAMADFQLDPDRKIRRGLLTVQDQGVDKHALAVYLAFTHLQAQGITAQENDGAEIRMGKAVFTPLDVASVGYPQTEGGGYQILLNWRGPQSSFPSYSLSALLAGQVPKAFIQDRIVLMGSTAVSTNDFFSTPFGNRTWLSNTEPMAGVVVHANLTHQIVQAATTGQGLLRGWPLPSQWIWILFWSTVGTTGGLCLDRVNASQKKLFGLREVGGLLFISSFLVGGTYLAFLSGWIIPTIPALAALISSSITAISWHKQERLEAANTQLGDANQQLLGYTKTLEQRVAERTQDLAEAKDLADDANQAKSRFLANMSHELRTPLNAILGFTQLLLRDLKLTGDQRERTEIIGRSGEHLLGLIDNVLVLSKIEAGRMTLNIDQVDLYRLLQTLEEMLQLEATAKGLKLSVQWATDVPQYIETDQKRLRQVLLNLLSNAVKFTHVGTVTLRIHVVDWCKSMQGNNAESTKQSATACRLCIEVEDTGPGIEAEELRTIFEPFIQTRTGLQAQQGTGLGLAISQQFVHLMAGTMTINSSPSQGTTVSLLLPVQLTVGQTIEHTKQKVAQLVAPVPCRILVAEGRWESRNLLGALLELVGFEVRTAEVGADVIDACQHWQPHAVFLDLQIPPKGGVEIAKTLAELHPSLAIIALTSHAFEQERTLAIAAGCIDCLYKPFDETTIFNALAEHLGVEYLYQDDSPNHTKTTSEYSSEPLSIKGLAQMPSDWLLQLDWAAQHLDTEQVLDLIGQIPAQHSRLAHRLKQTVKEFDFGQLMTAAQDAQKANQQAP
ncbi:MAG: CHASE2 domain-containing protein [Thermosynechococcaceae cyanobacterium]